MVYLRDCVPDLISALRAAHQHDEPSSPLPDAKTLGSLLDVAFGASMEPEEGRFATFGLGLIPAQRSPSSLQGAPVHKPPGALRDRGGEAGRRNRLDYNIARRLART